MTWDYNKQRKVVKMKFKIKEQLEKNHISRYKLQQLTNWNYKRIKAFYQGNVIEIKVKELETLCEIFACKIEDLIEY